MRSLGPLLDYPADLLPRYLALAHLERARRAHDRLKHREDDAALRRFRAALRRLRACLRGFRPLLAPDVRGGDLRRLRDLARSTAVLRDREVLAAWLARDDAGRPASPTERAARSWMLEQLPPVAPDVVLAAVAERFPATYRRLVRRLARPRLRLGANGGAPERSGRAALAEAMERLAGRLGARLDAVRSPLDRDELRRARSACRRLRYLVAPFRERVPGGAELVGRLRALQDLLDDLREGDTLLDATESALAEAPEQEAVVRAGLLALAEGLRSRRGALHAELERDWLGDAAGLLLAQVHAAAGALRGRAPEGVEIERKYLLSAMPPLPEEATALDIDQGWLPGERLQERVRRTRHEGGERWHRTVKLGRGVERVELEEEAAPELGRALWALTEGRRVRKRRYRVPDGGLVWEIDRFTDRDLVLAEVELPAVEAEVALPGWLAPLVVREVTGEAEYVNINLAR